MQVARRSPPEAFRAADGMYYRRMMTVQSDASHSTARRTSPPKQRLAIPASGHRASQPIVHDDRLDSRLYLDRVYEGDNFVLPSIEGLGHHKIAQHNPFARTRPSHSHTDPPEKIVHSSLTRREDLSRQFDIIDLTSPEDHHDTKRRKTENSYSESSMHRRYEPVEALDANETRYVPPTSAHLDRPPGYRQYPPADPGEQSQHAKTMQLGYGREPVHQTRVQPTLPPIHGVPAARPLEVLHHADEVHPSPSGRTNSAVAPRLRSLPFAQPHPDVGPRRTSFVLSNSAERVPVHRDMGQTTTPLEVIPPDHEVRDYRAIYAGREPIPSRRQPPAELEPPRSIEVFNGIT